MFDIGWTELLLIGIVSLIVIGPKDLPNMFRTVGNFVGKARRMAREFQRSMEDAADQAGLKEATKGLNDIKKSDPLGLNAIKDSNKKYTESILATREAKIAERAAKEEAAKAVAPKEVAPAPQPAPSAEASPATPAAQPKPAAKPKASSTAKPATGEEAAVAPAAKRSRKAPAKPVEES